MISTPRITVLLPVFNSARYLPLAIESVLRQSFGNYVLEIIDDGSSDNSLAIAQRYAAADGRIRIVAADHQGYTFHLRDALHRAETELIARMDADDISLPERLERQVDFLDAHQDIVAVGCDMIHIDDEGDPLIIDCHETDPERINAMLLAGGFGVIAHPTLMARRSVLVRAGGYRPELEPAEDFDLWLRLCEQGKLSNVPAVLFLYRQHLRSVGALQWQRQKKLHDEILKDARLRHGLEPFAKSVWRPQIHETWAAHERWARGALRHNFRRTARKHALRALAERPFAIRALALLVGSLIPRKWLLVLWRSLRLEGETN